MDSKIFTEAEMSFVDKFKLFVLSPSNTTATGAFYKNNGIPPSCQVYFFVILNIELFIEHTPFHLKKMRSTSFIKRGGILKDIRHLIFPQKCLSCEGELTRAENSICSICATNFTETNFHLSEEPTLMDKIFWGRISIEKTFALFFFEKTKTTQKVLFQLKYKNNPAVGHYFGKEMAKRIKLNNGFNDVDVFIPVPLHPKKEFTRGYNQSEALTIGILQEIDIPMDTHSIKRVQHGVSQTKKSRFDRWSSIQSTFQIKDSIKKYKHIVLVDDVITTGSTLEVIASAIREKHPTARISVVTLAIT